MRHFWHPGISILLQYALASHWCLLTLSPETQCHSSSGSNSSSYSYRRENGASRQFAVLLLCCGLQIEQEDLAHPGQQKTGVLHVSLHALSLSFWPKPYYYWNCSILSGMRFLCLHTYLHQHEGSRRSILILSKGSKVTAQERVPQQKAPLGLR